MLQAEEVAAMVRLHELGWGAKRLSKEFGCARNTVRRYLRASPSADDLWRRADVPPSALVRLAEADAFRPRREALWAINALRDTPLPLFAAADTAATGARAEAVEPPVALRPTAEGAEVVRDYQHSGLSLRAHPVSFLRAGLARRRIVPCAEAMDAPDGRTLTTAGIVLVRQMPGSAKGVLFVTIEDETGVANLVIWLRLYDRQRRVVLGAPLMAVRGRIQREGAVVHLIARRLTDLSAELDRIGAEGDGPPLPHAELDDGRATGQAGGFAGLPKARDMADPHGHIDALRVKPRDFR